MFLRKLFGKNLKEICNFKTLDGNTYLFNKGRIRLLCDECYEYYKKS